MGPIFLSPGDSHIEGSLVLHHPDLEGITEVDTDLKRGLCFNDKFLCVSVSSRYSTRKQLGRGRFFKGLQIYMKNKTGENENKIILEDFNCTMDKNGQVW